MRIFILEDNTFRMKKFRQQLIGHTIDHAETVQEGISLVTFNKYDLLFLDHDLGGEQIVDSSDKNTGYQVAEFIASFTMNKKTPCVVHSCNPAGADNIIRVLPHGVRIPFPLLNIASVVKWVGYTQERE